jgi:hypothetical protein
MDYKRVYIPKGEKGYRPLGVPQPEWRLLLHMYNQFLTFFVQEDLPSQHGFLPQKGTLTAWKEIFIKGLLNKEYIKEWDFVSYFDRIHVNRITEILLAKGVPKAITYFLENVNRSRIKLAEVDLLDESQKREQQASEDDIRGGVLNAVRKMYEPVKEFLAAQPGIDGYLLLNQFMDEDGVEDIQTYVQVQWALLDSFRPAKIPSQFEGVAQGANTSPILANLIMDLWVEKVKSQGHEIVAYADDSVGFSDRPIVVEPPEDTGIEIHKEKSGYVKFRNEWIKPLRFLGLEFDGKKFSANTRQGSKLVLTDKIKLLMEMFQELHDKTGILSPEELFEHINQRFETTGVSEKLILLNTWEDYFRSRLIGFVQSRLYNGDWNLEGIEQDFTMKFVEGSWMSTKLSRGVESIFDASSYASLSLLNIFRYNSKIRKPRRPRLHLRQSRPPKVGNPKP